MLLLWVWCFWWWRWWWFSQLLVSLFDWIEITNCRADSCKVDFNDGVVFASPFQSADLMPGSFLIVVLKHLKTRKISHGQLMNSTQYLISGVSIIIPTSHNHLLVYVSSSKAVQPPWILMVIVCMIVMIVSTIIRNIVMILITGVIRIRGLSWQMQW